MRSGECGAVVRPDLITVMARGTAPHWRGVAFIGHNAADGLGKLRTGPGKHEDLVSGARLFATSKVRTQPPSGWQVSADHR